MRNFTLVEWLIGLLIIAVLGVGIGSLIYEATFDYTRCQATEQYREQHRAAYTSYMTVNNVMIPTYHPAANWTERLYSCPENDGQRFDKWRRENRL